MTIDQITKIIVYFFLSFFVLVALALYFTDPYSFLDTESRNILSASRIDVPVSRAVNEGWTLAQADHLGAILYDMKTFEKQEDGSTTILIKKIYSKEGHERLLSGMYSLRGTLYSVFLMSFDCGSWEKALMTVKYVAADESALFDSEEGNRKKPLTPYTPIYENTFEEKIANAVCARCPERPRGSGKKRYVEPEKPERFPWSADKIWEKLAKTGSSASFNVRINEALPEYTFTIAGYLNVNAFNPTRIDVTDTGTGKRIQRIKAGRHFGRGATGESYEERDGYPIFQFFDLNYDGHLDMRVFIIAGATGLDWYATYLYNPKSRQFVYHRKLSELSYVTADPKNRLIISYDRSGYCEECRGHIKVMEDGRLMLKKIEWTDPGRDKWDNFICHSVTAVPREGVTVYLDKKSPVCPIDEKGIKFFKKRFRVVNRELMYGSLDDRARGPLGNPME